MQQIDSTLETQDKSKRFVLSKDHRSIFDKKMGKHTFFKYSVLGRDIEDVCTFLNIDLIKPETCIWT